MHSCLNHLPISLARVPHMCFHKLKIRSYYGRVGILKTLSLLALRGRASTFRIMLLRAVVSLCGFRMLLLDLSRNLRIRRSSLIRMARPSFSHIQLMHMQTGLLRNRDDMCWQLKHVSTTMIARNWKAKNVLIPSMWEKSSRIRLVLPLLLRRLHQFLIQRLLLSSMLILVNAVQRQLSVKQLLRKLARSQERVRERELVMQAVHRQLIPLVQRSHSPLVRKHAVTRRKVILTWVRQLRAILSSPRLRTTESRVAHG